MKKSIVYKTTDHASGATSIVRLVARHDRQDGFFGNSILGLSSFLPSSEFDRRLSSYITDSYQDGLQKDWNNVGNSLWLALFKHSAEIAK